jgi:hypothetical protein
MELDRENGESLVHDTLVRSIVGIDKQLHEVFREGGDIDSVTVVLRRDVAAARDHVCAGNVVTTVTELHLLGGGTRSKSEELVSQANTKDGGAGNLESLGQVGNGDLGHGWVTGSVGDEETVVVGVGVEIIVPGDDLDLDTASDKAADLVVFLFVFGASKN